MHQKTRFIYFSDWFHSAKVFFSLFIPFFPLLLVPCADGTVYSGIRRRDLEWKNKKWEKESKWIENFTAEGKSFFFFLFLKKLGLFVFLVRRNIISEFCRWKKMKNKVNNRIAKLRRCWVLKETWEEWVGNWELRLSFCYIKRFVLTEANNYLWRFSVEILAT